MRLPPRPAPSAWSSLFRWLRHWAIWFGWTRIAMAVLSVVIVAVTVVWFVSAPDPGAAESDRRGGTDEVEVAADAAAPVFTLVPPPPQMVAVHVLGAVVAPGVVWLDAGSRVVDAIGAAGGAAPGAALDAVNLAAVVSDGQRLRVPFQGEEIVDGIIEQPHLGPAGGGADSVASLIDLNRATADELTALPGIGPVTAAAIVSYRERHGSFGAVDDLLRVSGIGPTRLEAIRELVTV